MDGDLDIPGDSDDVELVTFLRREDDETEDSLSPGENDAALEGRKDNGIYHYNDAIDHIGFGIFHVIQTICVGIALSSDAVEVLVISLALPQLSHDLNSTDVQNAWLSSVIFMGMLVGDYGWGTLSDIIGRRSTMVMSLSINGLAGLLSSFAPTYGVFVTLRFIGGVGIGGSLAIIQTYMSEFITAKWRGKYLGTLATFWTFGKILVGGIAYFILPLGCKITINLGSMELHSWNVFLIIASIPALLGAGFFAVLPESPLHLLRAHKNQKAIGVLCKMWRWNQLWCFGKKRPFLIKQVILPPKTYLIATPSRFQQLPVIKWFPKKVQDFIWRPLPLFQLKYLRRTLLQLAIFFLLSLAAYGLTLWYPTYINNLEHRCKDHFAHDILSDPNICSDGSRLEDIIVNNTVWSGKHLKNAVFDHVVFQNTDFTRCSFEDCSFLHCSFYSVNLSNSSFTNTCFKYTLLDSNWDYDSTTFVNSYFNDSNEFGSGQSDEPCCLHDTCEGSCYDDANVDYSKVYLELFYVALATIPGCLLSAIMVDVVRRSYWMAFLFFLSAGSCVLLFFFRTPTLAVVALVVFSFVSVGTWNTSSLIAKEVYPTELRATASGILLSVARIGAILGIVLFGLFINAHPSIPILIAGSCFVAAAVCSLPLPATNRKTLLE